MPSPSPPPPSSSRLSPLFANDIPTCATLAGLAFCNDRQTQFKARDPDEPYDHESAMQGALRHWMAANAASSSSSEADRSKPSTRYELTKAVDGDDPNLILGWVCWGQQEIRTSDTKDVEASDTKKRTDEDNPNEQSDQSEEQKPDHHRTSSPNQKRSVRARLESFTSQDLRAWQTRFSNEAVRSNHSTIMFVGTLVVHAAHTGRGVGTALLRQGTEQADRLGVRCWVHSSDSPAALAVYRSAGFEEVGQTVVDLDAWNERGWEAPGEEEDEDVETPRDESRTGGRTGWGKYTFRYLVREPRN